MVKELSSRAKKQIGIDTSLSAEELNQATGWVLFFVANFISNIPMKYIATY